MTIWFDKALNVEPPLVFGVRLVSMTLGHCFALDRINSPYITGQRDKPLDAMLAAFVLCQGARTALLALDKWWAKPYFWLWGLRCRKLSFADEREKLVKFIAASLQPPDVIPPLAGEARELGSPFHWRLLAMLLGDFHMDVKAAMSCETGFALCLWAVEGERQGKLTLPTRDQVDFRARADAALAELEKSHGTGQASG